MRERLVPVELLQQGQSFDQSKRLKGMIRNSKNTGIQAPQNYIPDSSFYQLVITCAAPAQSKYKIHTSRCSLGYLADKAVKNKQEIIIHNLAN